jgi:uncharacterized protein (TIGR02996 family)
MTDQEHSLLSAIRDAPDDNALRLVYADWLEENGQADHAALVRLQLYLDDEKTTATGERRENRLTAKLRASWPASLAKAGLIIRRGVVAASWESVKAFKTGTALLKKEGDPAWVVERRLKLDRGSQADVLALVEQPGYGRLTRLEIEIRDEITVATARAIAGSPLSAGLRYLALEHAGIGVGGAQALAKSRHLSRLRTLHFYNTPLGSSGVRSLANSKILGELRELCLCCSAGGEAAKALAEAKGLRRLERLNLGSNGIGDARLRRLLKASWLGNIKEMILHSGAIRDGGAKALAECEALTGLRVLNLNSTQIGDEGAIALLESPHLRNLEELSLGFCQKLTEPVRRRIRRRFGRTGEDAKGRADVWM